MHPIEYVSFQGPLTPAHLSVIVRYPPHVEDLHPDRMKDYYENPNGHMQRMCSPADYKLWFYFPLLFKKKRDDMHARWRVLGWQRLRERDIKKLAFAGWTARTTARTTRQTIDKHTTL